MRLAIFLVITVLVGCARNPTAPGAGVPGDLVTVATVDVRAHSARIVWQVRHGVVGSLLVQRRLGDAPWKGLAHVVVDGDSRLTLEDVSVQPGVSYSYRVRIPAEPEPVYAGEVAVEVPSP